MEERQVDVAIIGVGSAGLYTMSKVRPAGKSVVLINGGELGTTCARVGCMPSKAAIQVAEDFHRKAIFARCGIEGKESLSIDVEEALEYVRDLRDNFVDRVTGNSTDNMPPEMLIEGRASFIDANTLAIDNGERVRANKIVIATGSRPVVPEAWKAFGDRVVTTDEFFELEELPKSIAVVGLGVIGLEIGQSMSRLGVDVVGVDMTDTIGGISDPEVAKTAIDIVGKEFPLWLGAAAEISEEADGRLKVTAGENSVVVDKVFASLGRRPNVDNMGLENIGAEIAANGVPVHNTNTMQLGDLPVFIAGDATSDRPLLHEAGDEGRIAGFNAANDSITAFKRKTSINITFADPNIVQVGTRFADLDPETTCVGQVQMAPVGRALIMGKNKGIIRVYADKATGVVIGAEMIAAKGENLAHLLAWCITENMTVGKMLQMPFYHPVIEEALQAALNDLYSKVDAKNAGPIMELETL